MRSVNGQYKFMQINQNEAEPHCAVPESVNPVCRSTMLNELRSSFHLSYPGGVGSYFHERYKYLVNPQLNLESY